MRIVSVALLRCSASFCTTGNRCDKSQISSCGGWGGQYCLLVAWLPFSLSSESEAYTALIPELSITKFQNWFLRKFLLSHSYRRCWRAPASGQ